MRVDNNGETHINKSKAVKRQRQGDPDDMEDHMEKEPQQRELGWANG